MGRRAIPAVAVVAFLLAAADSTNAQTREISLRGFGDVGSTTFAAAESFKAVFGSASGVVYGGGVEAVLPQRIFISMRASRFRGTGERLFVLQGQQFRLGIPLTVTVTPVELTGGYRVDFGRRVIPYGGGGIGWHQYHETSRFAGDDDDLKERFTGYHLLGGAEIRLARWVGTAAEIQWASVPDALGQDPNGVSREFNETNLGGVTLRVKVVVGQ